MFFKGKDNKNSQYLDGTQGIAISSRLPKIAMSFICAVMAVLFLLTSVNAHLIASVAFAEGEDEGKEKIEEAAKSYIPEVEEGEESTQLFPTLQKFKDDPNKYDSNSFAYVLNRMFTFNYLNDTAKAYVPKNVSENKDRQCEVDDPNAGTLIYHNCDVPNAITEVTQDFIATWSQQGAVGADTKSATLDSSIFGLPQGIPGNGAPVDPAKRSVKYTGLELYGYNLKYTDYNGEWDHIKVMTSARAMSNFGFMDDFKMGIHTVVQGVAGGVQEGATNFMNEMTSGNLFGAVGGAFTGFFSGAAAQSINTILDTSDHNVFSTYAWYRVGFGGTLYNARELTESESAARYQNSILDMIFSKSGPDTASVPEEIRSIKDGPPDPLEAISKCTIKNAKGKNEVVGSTSIAPGITKESCSELADNAFSVRQSNGSAGPRDKASYKWDAEGSQKKETLVQWKAANSAMINKAETNGMTCDLNTNEATRVDNIANYRLCWNSSYEVIAANAKRVEQDDSNLEWLMNIFNPANVMNWFTSTGSNGNPNAPWNRYICVDSKGNDILDKNGTPVKLYDLNGDLNPGCSPVRAPIQNGLFGNGYKANQTQPQTDTRWVSTNDNLMNTVFPLKTIATTIGNAGLVIAAFFTRVSNTVIAFSFNPPLAQFGIDKIIVKLIESFRESLFFPLIVLVIGFAGLQIIWNVGRKRDYQNQAISIVMICLTIFLGTILMFKPEQTIKAVDTIPAMAETAIMGSVFSLGNRSDDNLCHATGTVKSSSFKDFEGRSMGISATEGARVLMCENWRTFAFNPWVVGQWGTDYSRLYAAGSGKTYTMNNTNGSLVGDASVVMGGGFTERNWALYQLDATSTGTAYNRDLTSRTGQVDPNFYRIVDLQAGPNNGAGTDSRFFEDWTGNSFYRIIIGPFSAIIAIVGAITVIVYSIAKIQISIVVTLMLLMIPIMFLFGIHPTQGRLKLKGYLGSIVGLMLQRIVLVLMLAVLFRIVTQLGSFSENYFVGAFFTLAICIFFIRARKDILRMVFSAISQGFGQPVGQQFMDNPVQWSNKNFRDKETSSRGLIANTWEKAKVGSVSFAGGAVGSFMAGGSKEMSSTVRKDATNAAKQSLYRLARVQRHRGFGMGQTVVQAGRVGVKAAQENTRKSSFGVEARKAAFQKTKKYKDYEQELENYKAIESTEQTEKIEQTPGGKTKTEHFKLDSDGNKVIRPVEPKMDKNFGMSVRGLRNTNQYISEQKRIDKLATQNQRDYESLHESRLSDGDRLSEYMDDAKFNKMRHDKDIQIESYRDEIAQKNKELKEAMKDESPSGKISPKSQQLRLEIKNLKEEIKKAERSYNAIIDDENYGDSDAKDMRKIDDSFKNVVDRLDRSSEKHVSVLARTGDLEQKRTDATRDLKDHIGLMIKNTRNRKETAGDGE